MSLKIFACGDIVNSTGKKDFIDEKLIEIVRKSDISICNFEAPIEHENMQPIKKAGPHLFQSKKSIEYLQDAGFNFVSLANNHIYDYGQNGLEETIEQLKKYNIGYVGGGVDFNQAYKTKVFEKNEIKVGLVAACENEFGCLYENHNRGGYAWLLHHSIEDNIRNLKNECDFIIFMAHAGVEEIDIPIKEWRDRYKRLCDVGVDLVLGHHPHVPQGYEKYKDSLIFYSLGNFYFDTQIFANRTDDSYSVVFDFIKERKVNFDFIYHKKINGQTRLMKENQVNLKLTALCDLLENGYEQRNNKICVKLFYEYYYDYYKNALNSFPNNISFLKKIKWIIKYLIYIYIYKPQVDYKKILLLHNIKIDSHRFVVQRALSNIIDSK